MTSSPKRGVRNNNPGNIDFNPRNNWQGQLGIEV
ncbi:structural protein P5, partial [Pseudomonas sp. CA3A]|nr:structural protein P5 [Pseudomonas typographi]